MILFSGVNYHTGKIDIRFFDKSNVFDLHTAPGKGIDCTGHTVQITVIKDSFQQRFEFFIRKEHLLRIGIKGLLQSGFAGVGNGSEGWLGRNLRIVLIISQ